MKTFRWVLLFVPLLACLCGCWIFNLIAGFTYPYAFKAEITVADLSDIISWDEASYGTLEYAWGLMIDWDANVGTGDASGYDSWIFINHYSNGEGGESGLIANQINNGLSFAAVFLFWNGAWSFTTTEDEYSVQAYANGNAIGFVFDPRGLLPPPAAGYRTYFYTSYCPPPSGPAVGDDASIITASSSTTDGTGEPSTGGYPFIDIVSAQISYLPP